jgi:2-polyprenyl-6-methoxyphenol hydroxylase-like FAD-dependent oxidoreductase
LLSTSPLGDAVVAEYGFPYYHVHRGDLHQVLAAGVTPGRLALGRRLVGFDSAGHGVVLRFADGSSATGDVVVGADGIHSVVRRELLGAESPRFSGNSAWRGISGARGAASATKHGAWWNNEQHDTTHVQALAWLSAGRQVESVDHRGRRVFRVAHPRRIGVGGADGCDHLSAQ